MPNPGHEQRHEQSHKQPDTTDTAAVDGFKQGVRQMWASGDYPGVAERNIWDVGARLVRHVGVHRGDDVLDVACGSGNVAIRAAQAGVNVVGLDLTPELFGRACELADEAGVRVEWLEGDAEALPFGDDSFDAVFSSFGCMF
ncbi:MAG: methyltransferase domain-containing protein, partial [Thermoleophilia bacterium]|nr:methyltransferase domain-containing protein [Thermoleophilia bacterium]